MPCVLCIYSQFSKIDCGWKYSDIERLQDGQESSPAAGELPSVGSDVARFQETGSTRGTWLFLGGANPAEEHRQYDSSSGDAAAGLRAHAGQLLLGFSSFLLPESPRPGHVSLHCIIFVRLHYYIYHIGTTIPSTREKTDTTTRHTEKRKYARRVEELTLVVFKLAKRITRANTCPRTELQTNKPYSTAYVYRLTARVRA